jgi:hypothetical protein
MEYWVLMNEEGLFFHITQHHGNLIKSKYFRQALQFNNKQDAEKTIDVYKTFLKGFKPMKVTSILTEE